MKHFRPLLRALFSWLSERFSFFAWYFNFYPRPLRGELSAVRRVLNSGHWNMEYGGAAGAHKKLERSFADFIGVEHAVAVGSGGGAIQLALRSLGLKPGDEVIHQVDTCVANAFAVMNAGCTPLFVDTIPETFDWNHADVAQTIGPQTKALMPVHIWGQAIDIKKARALALQHRIPLVEDCCLALGHQVDGKTLGSYGDCGVYSFGCIKPLQTGEGGMIVTNDGALAKEMRSLRAWGNRLTEYRDPDITNLGMNARMSEIVAAVAGEQLKSFPELMRRSQEQLRWLDHRVTQANFQKLSLFKPSNHISPIGQLIVVLDRPIPAAKNLAMEILKRRHIRVRHANFEPMNRFGFFRSGKWQQWLPLADTKRVKQNYSSNFPGAGKLYDELAIGIDRRHYLSRKQAKDIFVALEELNRALVSR